MKKMALILLLLGVTGGYSAPPFGCPSFEFYGTQITIVWMGYEPVRVPCPNGERIRCIPLPCGDACNESECL